jgi:hypothetical protein
MRFTFFKRFLQARNYRSPRRFQSVGQLNFPLLALFLLLLSCVPAGLNLKEASDAEIRQHLQWNHDAVKSLRIEWSALLESSRLGLLPFRLDAVWNAKSTTLDVKTPLGGKLLALSCDERETRLQAGSALRPLLQGILKEASAFERLALTATLELLEGDGVRVGEDRITSEVVSLLLSDLPKPFRQALTGRPQALFSLVSGLYLPERDAIWYSHQRAFISDDRRLELKAARGMPSLIQLGDLEIQLKAYRPSRGVMLPTKICMMEPEVPRRLTLERRSVRLRKK